MSGTWWESYKARVIDPAREAPEPEKPAPRDYLAEHYQATHYPQSVVVPAAAEREAGE